MPAIFLVNDYAAFRVQDQIPRQFFDHVRYLPTVKEFIDGAKNTLETENLSELGQYVYTNVINIAEGFVGDDDYAHYFKKLINAVVEIIKAGTEGFEGLKDTYKDGPLAVTRIMSVGMGGFGAKLKDDDPEISFVKKFHSAQLLRCLPQTARFRPHQGCSHQCREFKYINLPRSLEYIGDCAFSGTGVREVSVPWKKPMETGVPPFENKTVIRVPKGAAETYLKTPVWGDTWKKYEFVEK